MTTGLLVFDKSGHLVLKKHKSKLEDEFIKDEDEDEEDKMSDDDGFVTFPTEDFNELEILTTDNYIEKHTIINRRRNITNDLNIPDNTKLTLQTNTSKITLQRDEVKELSQLGTQQKYALLAQAAYAEGNQTQINKLFSKAPTILGHFKLDQDLSTKKNSVFVNSNTGEVVISYKGTNPTDFEDLYDDFEIIRSQENSTSRFKKAEELYQKVESVYGKENVKIVGHSLGGSVGMFVGEKYNVESHLYNPGISAMRAFQSHRNNTHKAFVYHTGHDPVSVGIHLNHDSNREIIQVSQKDTIDPHGIDNFWKPKTHRTLEDINDDVSNNPIIKGANKIASEVAEVAIVDTPVGLIYETMKEANTIANDIKWVVDKIIP